MGSKILKKYKSEGGRPLKGKGEKEILTKGNIYCIL
jgi:hypothetical protein